MIATGALRRMVRSEQAWMTRQEQKGVNQGGGGGRGKKGEEQGGEKRENWKETNCQFIDMDTCPKSSAHHLKGNVTQHRAGHL